MILVTHILAHRQLQVIPISTAASAALRRAVSWKGYGGAPSHHSSPILYARQPMSSVENQGYIRAVPRVRGFHIHCLGYG